MGLGGPQAWLLNLPTAVVYGSLTLFITILHNVFLLYYVDTFVSVYKISKAAFWVGETVFLLWNSLNDPLFGWLSDRQFLSSQPRFVSWGRLTTGPVPPDPSPGLEDPPPVFGVGRERETVFSYCRGFLRSPRSGQTVWVGRVA